MYTHLSVSICPSFFLSFCPSLSLSLSLSRSLSQYKYIHVCSLYVILYIKNFYKYKLVYIYIYIYIYTCMHVCMHVCICICYIHGEALDRIIRSTAKKTGSDLQLKICFNKRFKPRTCILSSTRQKSYIVQVLVYRVGMQYKIKLGGATIRWSSITSCRDCNRVYKATQ